MREEGSAIPIALTSIGIAGIAGVSFHVLLVHCFAGASGSFVLESLLPALGGILLGAFSGAVMIAVGRVSQAVPMRACPACRARLGAAWRICPECGHIVEPSEQSA